MFKKLLEVAQDRRSLQVTVPNAITEDSSSSTMTIPAKLENIPVVKQVANDKQSGNWSVDYNEVKF